MRCIHCANNYGKGQSETILGKVIKGKRDDLVITSKVFTPVGPGLNDGGLSRYHILREVERTLKKLQTDHIDIYYLHKVDPETKPEETLRTMEDLVRQGKVRYVGASNYNGAQVVELLWMAERHSLEPIVCLQNQYNLLHRFQVEFDLLPVCRRFGLGLATWFGRRGDSAHRANPYGQSRVAHALKRLVIAKIWDTPQKVI